MDKFLVEIFHSNGKHEYYLMYGGTYAALGQLEDEYGCLADVPPKRVEELLVRADKLNPPHRLWWCSN